MRRLTAATALELRLQARYGIVPVAVALGVLWTLVLLAVPGGAAATVAAPLLFLDTAGFGALFGAFLLLFERVEGTRWALAVTPLRPVEGVTARVGTLTVLASCVALPMVAAALRDRPADLVWSVPVALGGVALTSVLLITACLALGARRPDPPRFLLAMPLVVAPLVVVPLAHTTGVLAHPLMYAVPTTAGAELIHRGLAAEPTSASPDLVVGVMYALAWAVLGLFLALPDSDPEERPGGPRARRRRGGVPVRAAGRGRVPAIARLARADLFGTGRDPLLLLLLCGPVLLALTLRVLFAPVAGFLLDSFGFDLRAHAPAVLAALVLLHVPMMFGVVQGLRAVEERDDGTLLVLRVSPVSVSAYLAYRMGLAGLASLVGLLVALPLSGPGLGGGAPVPAAAVLVAALQAPLLVALMIAFTGNKVEALVAVKVIGAFLVLCPVLAWSLPSPWNLLLVVLPPVWSALALPGYDPGPLSAWWCLLGGCLTSGAVGALLVRRARARVENA
ncbi:hypothetical protein PWG71_14640 [Nocardiopsis sp. N85]|uniref:fluoroquinolone export ABC transporter permease subunit n=1 Tax=Nocardiopsis sp. N85 TaxID=3029400 RepID=UPI00237F2ACC|nr:hypothetical protein [Nocardiopsis sp. N85]MDE3722624.1 hypothetical protein [Nocardiopsis sp. N85]